MKFLLEKKRQKIENMQKSQKPLIFELEDLLKQM